MKEAKLRKSFASRPNEEERHLRPDNAAMPGHLVWRPTWTTNHEISVQLKNTNPSTGEIEKKNKINVNQLNNNSSQEIIIIQILKAEQFKRILKRQNRNFPSSRARHQSDDEPRITRLTDSCLCPPQLQRPGTVASILRCVCITSFHGCTNSNSWNTKA